MSRGLLLGLAGVVLLAVHTVVTDLDTEPAERAGARIVELEGGDLRYRDQGDRDDPVVVLLHGFTASLEWWDRVAFDLERRNLRVIRFDLLGHGGSEKPRDGYAIEEQAARVKAALDELRVRRATVVGHSMGGAVASVLAETERALVRRVAIIGTAPASGYSELPLTARLARWPVIGHLIRRLAPDQAIRAGLSSAFADGVEVPDGFVDGLDGMTYTAYRRSSEATSRANERRSSAKRVERSRRPLLVIFGTEDEIVDPSAADAWERAVPAARVVRMRGVGHSPQWERPREVVRELLAFAR